MDVTDLPPEIKHAVRAMAYRMASFNGGRPDAGIILHTILRAGWDTIGAPDTTALTLEERQGLVLVILSVCRGIIEAKRERLADVVALDTDFPVPEPAEE